LANPGGWGRIPTGTGINPTLTIVANAWRVAEHIAKGRNTTRS
jgi:choline dehydrogenase-like flavoprotein